MPNRRLTESELALANKLLKSIRAKLQTLSKGDKELLFAYRRKVTKELGYDERSKPMVRRKLKERKWKDQRGLCAICNKDLPMAYSVLDRFKAVDGYTRANTRLIHPTCDIDVQRDRGYT